MMPNSWPVIALLGWITVGILVLAWILHKRTDIDRADWVDCFIGIPIIILLWPLVVWINHREFWL